MTFCDINPGRWIDVPANLQIGFNCWSSCYTALFRIYTVATICIFCIRTFLSIFAEIMSPIVFSIIWIISPTMSPMYLDYFVKTSSPMYFWWRSWTWKLFRIRFACFRIQFLPDHIMIHSCLVCVCAFALVSTFWTLEPENWCGCGLWLQILQPTTRRFFKLILGLWL